MRAVMYDQVGELPSVVDVPVPEPAPDGIVVQVTATGVCRSDWHAWQGHDPVPLPMVPGHEFAGVVSAVGANVAGVSVGDRVTVPFVVACQRCEVCAAGEAQVCPHQSQPGFTFPGSWAEYVAIAPADGNVVRLPDALDDVSAAALGCRFATAYRALVTHGRVAPGQWVAVYGCGGLGLSAVMIAHALGARVVAVDIAPDPLHRATELGADVALTSRDDTPVEIQQVTGGAHVSLDALGSVRTAVASVCSLRRRGRHVQAGLLLGATSTPPLPMDRVIAWELEIYGSHGMPASDYPSLLDLAARLDIGRLVSRVVGLNEAPAALAALSGPAAPGITVVDPRR